MSHKKELKQLIELCKLGDRKAQQSIFELKKDELFAICKRYASNSSEAEDMFIEGFSRIFRFIDSYSNGEFDGWIKRIMINTCISIYKKETKRREVEIIVDDFQECEEIKNPEKFSIEDLYHCIEQLSDKQRTIFNLFTIDGYKTKEIADLLNTTDDSVRTTLHRSKNRLRQLLEELEKNRKA